MSFKHVSFKQMICSQWHIQYQAVQILWC